MTTNEPTTEKKRTREDVPWILTIIAVIIAEFVGMVAYATTESSIHVFACELLVAMAAGVVGGLIGFVFGIPKSSPQSTAVTTEAGTVTTRTVYQGNSNLEQISDWLTKILIGAGLVELKNLGDALERLGASLAQHNCLGSCGSLAGPAIVVGFSTTGFLLSYLWARIYMINELRRAGAEAEDVRKA